MPPRAGVLAPFRREFLVSGPFMFSGAAFSTVDLDQPGKTRIVSCMSAKVRKVADHEARCLVLSDITYLDGPINPGRPLFGVRDAIALAQSVALSLPGYSATVSPMGNDLWFSVGVIVLGTMPVALAITAIIMQ